MTKFKYVIQLEYTYILWTQSFVMLYDSLAIRVFMCNSIPTNYLCTIHIYRLIQAIPVPTLND